MSAPIMGNVDSLFFTDVTTTGLRIYPYIHTENASTNHIAHNRGMDFDFPFQDNA